MRLTTRHGSIIAAVIALGLATLPSGAQIAAGFSKRSHYVLDVKVEGFKPTDAPNAQSVKAYAGSRFEIKERGAVNTIIKFRRLTGAGDPRTFVRMPPDAGGRDMTLPTSDTLYSIETAKLPEYAYRATSETSWGTLIVPFKLYAPFGKSEALFNSITLAPYVSYGLDAGPGKWHLLLSAGPAFSSSTKDSKSSTQVALSLSGGIVCGLSSDVQAGVIAGVDLYGGADAENVRGSRQLWISFTIGKMLQ